MGVLKNGLLCAVAALMMPLAANAQQFTVDYTGVVTSSDFAGASAGMMVTGTYTFNFDDANPLESDNGIQVGEPWYRETTVGANTIQNLFLPPVPATGSVFTSTAQVGGLTYASSASPPVGSFSRVMGGGNFEYGVESETTGISSLFIQSGFEVLDPNFPDAQDGNGVPLLNSNTMGTGYFGFEILNGDTATFERVNYSLTNLALAPEIDATCTSSALTLLFGSLLVLRGRRRQRSAA